MTNPHNLYTFNFLIYIILSHFLLLSFPPKSHASSHSKMGIHELSKVVGDKAPAAVKENDIKNYFGVARFLPLALSLSLTLSLVSSLPHSAPLASFLFRWAFSLIL